MLALFLLLASGFLLLTRKLLSLCSPLCSIKFIKPSLIGITPESPLLEKQFWSIPLFYKPLFITFQSTQFLIQCLIISPSLLENSSGVRLVIEKAWTQLDGKVLWFLAITTPFLPNSWLSLSLTEGGLSIKNLKIAKLSLMAKNVFSYFNVHNVF